LAGLSGRSAEELAACHALLEAVVEDLKLASTDGVALGRTGHEAPCIQDVHIAEKGKLLHQYCVHYIIIEVSLLSRPIIYKHVEQQQFVKGC
jgi:hypothetical protein